MKSYWKWVGGAALFLSWFSLDVVKAQEVAVQLQFCPNHTSTDLHFVDGLSRLNGIKLSYLKNLTHTGWENIINTKYQIKMAVERRSNFYLFMHIGIGNRNKWSRQIVVRECVAGLNCMTTFIQFLTPICVAFRSIGLHGNRLSVPREQYPRFILNVYSGGVAGIVHLDPYGTRDFTTLNKHMAIWINLNGRSNPRSVTGDHCSSSNFISLPRRLSPPHSIAAGRGGLDQGTPDKIYTYDREEEASERREHHEKRPSSHFLLSGKVMLGTLIISCAFYFIIYTFRKGRSISFDTGICYIVVGVASIIVGMIFFANAIGGY